MITALIPFDKTVSEGFSVCNHLFINERDLTIAAIISESALSVKLDFRAIIIQPAWLFILVLMFFPLSVRFFCCLDARIIYVLFRPYLGTHPYSLVLSKYKYLVILEQFNNCKYY